MKRLGFTQEHTNQGNFYRVVKVPKGQNPSSTEAKTDVQPMPPEERELPFNATAPDDDAPF